jgi:RNA polymerase sigma-70 factor, ECF subfamily
MIGLFGDIEAMVPALRRYAMAMLSDQGAADDAVQACLADAIGRPQTSRDETELRVRLLGAVYRRLAVQQRPWRGISSSPRTHSSRLAWTDLTRAFAKLTMEQRSVMFLVSVEDLPYAGVAEVMGMPVAKIMSLLAGGREQLRQSGAGETSLSPRRMS